MLSNLLASVAVRVCQSWARARDRVMLGLFRPDPSARVIDLGCGGGGFTRAAQDRIGCAQIEGVDTYGPFVAEARGRGILVTEHDLESPPLPFAEGSFDVVVANQVIEHLLFPAQFMREVYRLVRPGGYAVLSTENLASWDNVAALVLGFTPFSMEFDGGFWKIGNPLSPHAGRMWTTYAPHARIFTLAGLRDLARLAGFRVEAAMGTGHVLGPPMQCVDPRHCRFISIRCRRDPASRGEPVPHA